MILLVWNPGPRALALSLSSCFWFFGQVQKTRGSCSKGHRLHLVSIPQVGIEKNFVKPRWIWAPSVFKVQLQILFVEHVDDLRRWDYPGYDCDAQIDLNNRHINLYYTKKKGSRIGFNLVYLSIIAVCIFYLWSKYRPEQNYMNPI